MSLDKDTARGIIVLIDGVECDLRRLERRLTSIRGVIARQVLGEDAPQSKAAEKGEPNDDGRPKEPVGGI